MTTRSRTIVFMYHDIVDVGRHDASGFVGEAAATYKVDADAFAGHIEALGRVAEPAPLVTSDGAFVMPREGCLVTFDDGGASALTHAAPVLEALGWRGVFFVTAGCIGRPGFLSAEQIRELRRRGHVIGSHSVSHPPRMAAMLDASVFDEWQRSRDTLSDIICEPVEVASVPNGSYRRRVAQYAAEAGIQWLFTSDPTTTWHSVGACRVVGRYCVRASTTSAWIAAVGSRAPTPRYLQWASWHGKGVAKVVAFGAYRMLRSGWSERRALNRARGRHGDEDDVAPRE